ncbi:uncharacterized protein [Onthophagus taurus]|uniref:uncharacterized protein n=1 Tax=Onthophagus taurus TaxID=166361 RepID=UPI0039BEA1D7
MFKKIPFLVFTRIEPYLLWLHLILIVSAEFGSKYIPQLIKKPETQLMKVSLTQKGYIQFLRYTVDVPTIEEFTYCMWLKSSNFTFSHPLLSYSKNEHERLIRGWIDHQGRTINLEILTKEIYSVFTDFVENQWYHICQSWNSHSGSWSLFIDGKLRESGVNSELQQIPIPEGGDIVIGQEYTDFEKGLDDGIEGDIFGFNLILSSISTTPLDKHQEYELPPPNDLFRRKQTSSSYIEDPTQSLNMQRRSSYIDYSYPRRRLRVDLTPPELDPNENVPEVLGYFNVNRRPKGFLDFGKGFLNMLFGDDPKTTRYVYPKSFHLGKRIINNVKDFEPIKKSLGMILVEESYNDCAKGNGSPVKDEKVLISWTKTPVRVFGGALLKLVPPFCVKIS